MTTKQIDEILTRAAMVRRAPSIEALDAEIARLEAERDARGEALAGAFAEMTAALDLCGRDQRRRLEAMIAKMRATQATEATYAATDDALGLELS